MEVAVNKRFQPYEILLFCVVAGCCFAGGIIFGVVWIGPHWFVSQNCVSYPFLLLDPHQYIACRLP
jgi:hypothetical protein